MKKIIYLIALSILVGCNGKHSKMETQSNKLVTIDLSKIDLQEESSPKEIPIQEIADVEYIPMETRSDVLLDGEGLQIFVSDSLIVTTNRDGSIFVFNRQGKNLHVFNHVGRGAEEYQSINFMSVGFNPQEIYITDYQQKQKIKVYAFDGTFKRDIQLPDNYVIAQFYEYDQESLIAVNDYDLDLNKKQGIVAATNKQPYGLISKKDGQVTPLPLFLEERVPSGLYVPEIAGQVGWGIVPFIKNGDQCLIADFASDTIYRVCGQALTPLFVKYPAGMWKLLPQKLFCIGLNSDRYTFFEFMEKKYPDGGYKRFVYDRQSGEFYQYQFINQDCLEGNLLFLSQAFGNLPLGYTHKKLSASLLLQNYEAGKLTGKLAEIASRLTEDDNYVLMLVKFKK